MKRTNSTSIPLEDMKRTTSTSIPVVENLTGFFDHLKEAGVNTSLAQFLEALSALDRTGFFDKIQLYFLLKAYIIDNKYQEPVFRKVFNQYFVSEELRNEQKQINEKAVTDKKAAYEQGKSELRFQGEHLDIDGQLLEVYTKLNTDDKKAIIDFLEKTSTGKNVTSKLKPLVEKTLSAKLSAHAENQSLLTIIKPAKQPGGQLEGQSDIQPARQSERQSDIHPAGQFEVQAYEQLAFKPAGHSEGQPSGKSEVTSAVQLAQTASYKDMYYGSDMLDLHMPLTLSEKERSILEKPAANISEEEIPVAVRLIKNMAIKTGELFRKKHSFSKKLSYPDIKKTIHESLKTGGVPFRIKSRGKKPGPKNIIILCDVSSSMLRFSGFALNFIYSLTQNSAKYRVYLFSGNYQKLDRKASASISTFEKNVKESAVWGGNTNISIVLEAVLKDKKERADKSDIVLIISDAKTLEWEKTAKLLKILGSVTSGIIWLNPVTENQRNKIPGMELFSKLADMLDCSTLSRMLKSSTILARKIHRK